MFAFRDPGLLDDLSVSFSTAFCYPFSTSQLCSIRKGKLKYELLTQPCYHEILLDRQGTKENWQI